MSIRIVVLALALAMLAGCTTYRHASRVQDGPGLEFDARDVSTFRENQDKVLEQLLPLAGLSRPPDGNGWMRVIDAGMDYADGKCEAYMHALFRLNRDRKTVTSQIGLLATATAGLMAAAESAAKEVATAAVLFGLAGSTVDNLSSNLLYELDPSSVRTLVKTLQSRFRGSLGQGYASRPAAMRVIRAYAMLCVPANIEAEVNLAVKASAPVAEPGDPSTGQPPEVTNAGTSGVSFVAAIDDNTARLRGFVFPGGTLNSENRAKLEDFMRSRGILTDVSSFMRLERFATDRADAVTALGLR